jgi:hypothetical protein
MAVQPVCSSDTRVLTPEIVGWSFAQAAGDKPQIVPFIVLVFSWRMLSILAKAVGVRI